MKSTLLVSIVLATIVVISLFEPVFTNPIFGASRSIDGSNRGYRGKQRNRSGQRYDIIPRNNDQSGLIGVMRNIFGIEDGQHISSLLNRKRRSPRQRQGQQQQQQQQYTWYRRLARTILSYLASPITSYFGF